MFGFYTETEPASRRYGFHISAQWVLIFLFLPRSCILFYSLTYPLPYFYLYVWFSHRDGTCLQEVWFPYVSTVGIDFFCFSPEAAFYYSYLPVCTDMTYTVDWVLKTNNYLYLPVPCQLFASLLCLVTMQGHFFVLDWKPARFIVPVQICQEMCLVVRSNKKN